jgi:hypothetical protein
MQSGTSIYSSPEAPFEHILKVGPSDESLNFPAWTSEAVISIFDILSSRETSQGTDVRANQCALWFCLQSYKVTVTQGIINKAVTAEWAKCNRESKGTANNDQYTFLDIPPEMNASNDTAYFILVDARDTLKMFIDGLTRGSAVQAAGRLTHDTDWIQAIDAASDDLSSWIGKLATSLTNNIQLTGTVRPGGNLYYGGTAYVMDSQVEVNWYWVAYPVTLMVFAFLYLVQTVWRTAHDQVCAWKTDSLPVSSSPNHVCLFSPE